MPVYEIPTTTRTVLGVDCPILLVPLAVATAGGGTTDQAFVLDTGAAITLFPITLADEYQVPYDPRADAGDDAPKTLAGKLAGHPGELRVRLGETPFVLPCFFYRPAAPPAPARPRRPHRCVLGRLGFLNRVDLLVRRADYFVAAGGDRVPVPAKPKPARLAAPRR